MDEPIKTPEMEDAPVTVCDIRFRNNTKTYFFDPDGLALKNGDHVIIETSRGPEFGYCSAGAHEVPAHAIVPPLRKVLRLATEKDEYVNEDNRRLEKSAFTFCQERIEKLGLDMRLVSCEVVFDGSKIMFYFTSDGRVDFRELVKQLASNFHTRVELRQIGVRDKAKMLGGLGICGRPFCCGQFLSDFAPVSIKMAKTQNLSLNPTKISGTCGRLMCCLKYEQEAYEDLLKTSPKVESFVDTPDGRGTVTDVNLMGQSVKVRLDKDPDELRSFRNDEIAIFRNGKPKKTDEPIPDDWAPISGGRPKPAPAEEFPRFERPAKAASPAPQLIDTTPTAEPVAATEDAEKPAASKRRSRGGKNKKKPAHAKPAQAAGTVHEAPAKQQPAANAETASAAKAEAAPAEKQKKDGHKGKPVHAKKQKQGEKPKQDPAKAAPAEKTEASGADAAAKKNKKRRYYHNNKPKKQG